MRWFEEFKGVLGRDNDGELGRADLVALAARGILSMARRDAKGNMVLPPGVLIAVTAADGSLETLRGWVKDPATNKEIDARLLNERIDAADLPARRWTVARADKNGLEVVDDPDPVVAVLVVDGGDRHGDRFPVGPGRREWRIGRGRWHGDNRLPNDIVLAESAPWLSRGAAVLRRAGSGFEVESRAQGEFLVVIPRDGTPRRPALTASGRVPLHVGDLLEFHDGNDASIRLRVEAPPEAAPLAGEEAK